MTTATAARPTSSDGAHWYKPDGTACHTVIAKSTGEPRPTTLADARKLGLVPSVTTILKILNKPALNDWLIEQSVLACLTTPRLHSENLDEFVHRVLHVERVQDQESTKARDLGTDIHAGMEALFRGERIDDELRPWIEPAYLAIQQNVGMWEVEKVVVGDGYAGKVDLIQECPNECILVDWKTTKNLPKSAWPEHRLQLSLYADAYQDIANRPKRTVNVYISTADCGKYVICEHDEWMETYNNAARPLVRLWQWQNSYYPALI